ncbi:ATP-dependent RNA helicase DDX42 isoform X1 [Chiloscyllium plagiosum]|uniref:ATP-dependent RNA helicase DDX42 isoform X1 n=2 Tax=Chiloscyllium plagiosum TaxID=36176 RepID=UPI001CB85AEF|nr:ATP-dependent RNA helicase DDX42 isoform X1 [Chiloscyllium plagiosum]
MNWNKGGGGAKRGFGFGGFAITPGKKEEPKLPKAAHSVFGALGPSGGYGKTQPAQTPCFYKVGSKRPNFDEENAYFEDDDEDDSSANVDLPYIPAENSPTRQQFVSKADESEDSEEDPLDAYMAEVEDQAAKDIKRLDEKEFEKKNAKGIRDDIEEEDDHEAYFRYMAENPNAGVIQEEEDDIEYDSDGNPIPPLKKVIDPLPPIDHSEIEYQPFEKNFYIEHEELAKLSLIPLAELRQKLNLRVSGADPPKPCSSFAHFGFDEQLMHQIRKSEYTQPTPIQCQGVPIALSGRDMIGIAKTGSGKTAAFIWPMLIHIMDQRELEPGDGPIGVIVCPTRELCQQIHSECRKFGKAYNLRSVAVYGGGSMWEQAKALQEGAEIVVCTPGRLIDHVKKKATNLQRVTYLVFDEADRMFDMGFEYQVRSIANHVRPDRQTLLFSATFRKKIERLARDILVDPIRVVQGDIGEANEDITQIVEILVAGPDKWNWLTRRLVELSSRGSVLIFVTKKANSEELAANLNQEGYTVGLLHGDMDQSERNKVISDFKKKTIPVLVATDVAARGLDIPSIKTVINYDVARDIDTHTHRIGRTGRAGEKGVAYTLMTNKDSNFAGDLVRNLEGANQYVSKELLDLAMQNPWFRKSRYKAGKGKRMNIGGGGLGYRERPGLGSDSSDRTSSSVLSNYEAYKPSTGAMGDRMSAMKAAFQSQYKSHFVAATGSAPKITGSAAGTSNWTSAGSLSIIPTCPLGNPVTNQLQVPSSNSGSSARNKDSNSRPAEVKSNRLVDGSSSRFESSSRHSDNFGRHSDGGSRYSDSSSRHGDSSSRHSVSKYNDRGGDGRHSDRGSERHGDRNSERYVDRSDSRHSDRRSDSRHGDRHGESRSSDSRHSESRSSSQNRSGGDSGSMNETGNSGENRSGNESRNGDSRSGSRTNSAENDGFAVPEPPPRKKRSRWDN